MAGEQADVESPDQIRIDLDPQPGTDFSDAVWVAPHVRELLAEFGMQGWPKTSGGRGVHIYVPIQPRWTFQEVRRSVIAFGRELERRLPDRVTMNWWKEERGEKIFIDYNQMARDRTIASAYSIRPKPRAPVSAPLDWDELPDVTPFDFDVLTMPARSPRSATSTPAWPTTRSASSRCSNWSSARRRTSAWARCPGRPTTRRCRASRCGCSPAARRSPPSPTRSRDRATVRTATQDRARPLTVGRAAAPA